ncbi:hypothetical protein Dsin_004578, partial [Dipteronia sinensis]
NASANTSSIALFFNNNISQDGGYFFHQWCACHIINLVVKSSMKVMGDRIDRIRDTLSWISSFNTRLSDFGRYCQANSLRPRQFQTNMSIRWNSTYLILQNCLDYSGSISCFYNMIMAEIDRPLLALNDWYVAKIFVQFLKVFYDSTLTLSGIYYPTSSQKIHQIEEMSEILNMCIDDEILGTTIVAMEKRVILDPMVKLSGLETFLDYISSKLVLDFSKQFTDLQTKLFEVFSIYESRFGSVNTQPSEEQDTLLLKRSWSMLNRRKSGSSSSSSSSS